jgi:hypothetical protein
MTYTITQTLEDQTKSISDSNIDGYIIYNPATSSYTSNTDKDFIRIQMLSSPSIYYRAYVEWDISSLPSASGFIFSTASVSLIYDCTSHVTACNTRAMMNLQPSVSSASMIYGEIGTGPPYSSNDVFPVVGENQVEVMGATSGATICSDLDTAVSKGSSYFSVGFRLDHESENWINNIDTSDVAVPYPTLFVKYDFTGSVELNSPTNISKSHVRNIKEFLFWDGSETISDWGKQSETIIISGFEYSSATQSMKKVEEMMRNRYQVSITGLPDSEMNTDYIIRNLDYERRGGNVDIYEYTLTLERYT